MAIMTLNRYSLLTIPQPEKSSSFEFLQRHLRLHDGRRKNSLSVGLIAHAPERVSDYPQFLSLPQAETGYHRATRARNLGMGQKEYASVLGAFGLDKQKFCCSHQGS